MHIRRALYVMYMIIIYLAQIVEISSIRNGCYSATTQDQGSATLTPLR